jgi:MoxR-like ATPase
MQTSSANTKVIYQKLDQLDQQLGNIILGKRQQVQLALTCLLASGHLLIEDLPGMGKTTLAQGLAKVFGLEFQRVQFTSDLMPADVIGCAIYQQATGEFHFHQGPVFTQVLLADEINRASPKTQSALLEAMGEYQVTAEGDTYELPSPFFVIATQNPLHQSGTFPLPESQLDRFMMRLSLGYPSHEAERLLLKHGGTQASLAAIEPVMTLSEFKQLQGIINHMKTSDSLLDYLQRLITFTRGQGDWSAGLSPRAALSWLHCAKAWAFIQQRDYVTPDDIQAVTHSVIAHRLLPRETAASAKAAIDAMIRQVNVIE